MRKKYIYNCGKAKMKMPFVTAEIIIISLVGYIYEKVENTRGIYKRAYIMSTLPCSRPMKMIPLPS